MISETLHFITLFKPKISDLKARIEHLIESEYIKRDEDDTRNYIYIPWVFLIYYFMFVTNIYYFSTKY